MCSSTTVPYVDDDKDSTRIARNNKGKNIYVDGNMTYDEWDEKYNRVDIDKNDDKAYNVGVDKLKEKQFRKIELDKSSVFASEVFNANDNSIMSITAYEAVGLAHKTYISKRVGRVKPKVMQKSIEVVKQASRLVGLEAKDIPPIMVCSEDEFTSYNVLASYLAKDNILKLKASIGKDRSSMIDLETAVHEMFHRKDMVDAMKVLGYSGELSDEQFMKCNKWIKRRAKRACESLKRQGVVLEDISEYAAENLEDDGFEEVYTEYRTKQLLED